ncbi:hypothetical protein MY10362_006817 [Beauveria mimosiformis]
MSASSSQVTLCNPPVLPEVARSPRLPATTTVHNKHRDGCGGGGGGGAVTADDNDDNNDGPSRAIFHAKRACVISAAAISEHTSHRRSRLY